MIPFKVKLPFFRRMLANICCWNMYRKLGETDEFSKSVLDQYGFVGFLTLGFD